MKNFKIDGRKYLLYKFSSDTIPIIYSKPVSPINYYYSADKIMEYTFAVFKNISILHNRKRIRLVNEELINKHVKNVFSMIAIQQAAFEYNYQLMDGYSSG